jgi:hypothetical protein
MRLGLITAIGVAVLAFAAPAQAAKGTYAGTVGTTTGRIALDVKIDRYGVVRKITRIRGAHVPSTCEISGPIPEVSFEQPAGLPVKPSNGKFSGDYTQPTYGNVSTISGAIRHKQVSGTIQVNYHYAAEAPYPEESCDTGLLPFHAKLGATDETVTTTPPPSPRWR